MCRYMQAQGVLIIARLGDTICSKCSGIKINNWIITHGTIIMPFINEEVSNINLSLKRLQVTFEVLIQKDKRNDIERYNATLQDFYEHGYLSDIIKKSLSAWIYEIEDQNNEIVKGLSLFLLLEIEDQSLNFKPKPFKIEKESFHLGMDILVESTPFAATPFFNSWSRGVVSKVLDVGNQLVLIDSRIAVGAEGAPIYSYHNEKKKNLIGMVICILNQYQEELIGLTLGCSILPVLQYFITVKTLPATVKLKADLDILKSSVVFIRCGNMWGSGTVINSAKGIILTCSHIIKNNGSTVFVMHRLLQGLRLPAKVVYATPKELPYDLAVLRITPNACLKQLNLSNSLPSKGENVISAGYSILSEYDPMGLGITISQGTISSMDKNGPLHITSSVHGGASGGAILKPPNQLIGIIVCNSKIGNHVLPEFSMGLSVRDIYRPLKRYMDTDDPVHLNKLTVSDKNVILKWKLNFQSKL